MQARVDNQSDRRAEAADLRRRARWALLGAAWKHSSLARVQRCRRRRARIEQAVKLRWGADGAHFTGLQTCGSVWACPVCAAKIRAHRANEVEQITRQALSEGLEAWFVTTTAPHSFGDDLGALWDAIAGSWTDCVSGRAWRELCQLHGVTFLDKVKGSGEALRLTKRISTMRSIETPFGAAGWHPHLHTIVLCQAGGGASVLDHLEREWFAAVQRHGLRSPLPGIGFVASAITVRNVEEVSSYIVKEQDGRKIGSELTRHDLKQGRRGGRTPFQLLEDFLDTGDLGDLAVYRDYEQASRGRQAVTFGKGLRERFNVEALTDEQIAELEVGWENEVELTDAQVVALLRDIRLMVALLEAAEAEGAPGIAAILCALGSDDSPDQIRGRGG